MPPIVSEEYKRRKKKEILESALVCFARKGVHAATIDDIVAHSKISKGAIYNYFKSKEEIYLELINEETKELHRQLTERVSSFESATEKLVYFFKLFISGNPSHPERKRSVIVHYEFRLHSIRDDELQKLVQETHNSFILDLLTTIIEEGKVSKEFKADIDAQTIANLIWAIIDGATFQGIANNRFPYENVFEYAEAMILSTIRADVADINTRLLNERFENMDMFMDRIYISLF